MRAGLLATQAIRGGANRQVLDRIKDSGDIFWAQSDRKWLLAGATVHVSKIGFNSGRETTRVLDDQVVAVINSNLTSAIDLTKAKELPENDKRAYIGTQKGGPFDISGAAARRLIALPANVNGKSNSDVVRPWINGDGITGRPADMWIIDFGI